MKEEELENISKPELVTIFVDLINEMEKEGLKHMEYYNNSDDKEFDIDKFACAGTLLTRVNRMKAKIWMMNKEKCKTTEE